jgi:hypothetical protein
MKKQNRPTFTNQTQSPKENQFIFNKGKRYFKQRPISPVYPVIDTDLGRDNVENDLTAADLQDL